MVRPTTGRDCCCNTAATVEESTPPDMAMATSPGCASALTGRVSNCVSAGISFTCILAGFGYFAIGGREFAELRDGGGNGFESVIDFGFGGVAPEAEADAGARVVGRKADGGEDV